MAIHIITLEDFKEYQDQTNHKLDHLTKLLEEKNDPDRLVTKSELAKIISCAESTIDNMRRRGKIQAYYIGTGQRGKPLFNPKEVIASLSKG